MLLCMTDLLGLILSTILVLLIELIESALEHLVDILRYINVYVLLLQTKSTVLPLLSHTQPPWTQSCHVIITLTYYVFV